MEAHVEAFPAPVEEQPEVSGSFQLFAFLVSAAGAPIPQINSSNQAWNNFIRSQKCGKTSRCAMQIMEPI